MRAVCIIALKTIKPCIVFVCATYVLGVHIKGVDQSVELSKMLNFLSFQR